MTLSHCFTKRNLARLKSGFLEEEETSEAVKRDSDVSSVF